MNWLEQLQELGELGVKMAGDIPTILVDPDLTHDQAAALFQSVDKSCQAMDDLMFRLRDAAVDDTTYRAAKAAQEVWDALGEATATKMIELRG